MRGAHQVCTTCAPSPQSCPPLPSLYTVTQVTGVFARRGYNVQSLAVGSSEREGMSRICMMVPGTQVGAWGLMIMNNNSSLLLPKGKGQA